MSVALIGAASGCVPGAVPTLIPRPERGTFGGRGVGVCSAGFMAQMDLTRVRNDRVVRARWNIMGDDGNWSGNTPRSVSELSVLVGRGRICCGGSPWGSYAIGGGRGLEGAQ